jgi:adenosylcobinamide-phosphate guanylyltransferase
MRALIMAGGSGSRLQNSGEKPLTLICNRPMLEYVTDAFRAAGCEPVVVISTRTPMTANWCRARGIAVIKTDGDGYVGDMVQAVQQLGEEGPVMVSVSDIPCITSRIIGIVIDAFRECGKHALSTWVVGSHVRSCRGSMPYRKMVDGVEACPAGINVLTGEFIEDEQDEYELLLDEPLLAVNVNTPEDLVRTESVLQDALRQN